MTNALRIGHELDEISVDLFCGGGGASTGIEAAQGVPIDAALNHDQGSIETHASNHPRTRHFCEDIFAVQPGSVFPGRKIGTLWASPSCTQFSLARGNVPADEQKRSLAWAVIRWAIVRRPRRIFVENVGAWENWGRLGPNGKVDPKHCGEFFQQFVGQLRALGYAVDWKVMDSADHGAWTSRERIFLVARCDGHPIAFPAQTHGPGKLPHKRIGDLLDFSRPCPSIFDPVARKAAGMNAIKAAASFKRMALGTFKYVLNSSKPFLIRKAAGGDGHVRETYGWLAQHYTGVVGRSLDRPMPTILTVPCQNQLVEVTVGTTKPTEVVAAFIAEYYGSGGQWQSMDRPVNTITTHDRFQIVECRIAKDMSLLDVGCRMFTVQELKLAQGFGPDYVLTGSLSAQKMRIGNSVVPLMAELLVRANP